MKRLPRWGGIGAGFNVPVGFPVSPQVHTLQRLTLSPRQATLKRSFPVTVLTVFRHGPGMNASPLPPPYPAILLFTDTPVHYPGPPTKNPSPRWQGEGF